jgi:hypothetical protein
VSLRASFIRSTQDPIHLAAPPPDVPQTPIGWPIVPEAFREALLAVDARYRLPIYVLENGFGAHDAPDGSGRILDLVGPAEPFIQIIDPNMGDRLERHIPQENETGARCPPVDFGQCPTNPTI